MAAPLGKQGSAVLLRHRRYDVGLGTGFDEAFRKAGFTDYLRRSEARQIMRMHVDEDPAGKP